MFDVQKAGQNNMEGKEGEGKCTIEVETSSSSSSSLLTILKCIQLHVENTIKPHIVHEKRVDLWCDSNT